MPTPKGEQRDCPHCNGVVLFAYGERTIYHSHPTCEGFARFARETGGRRDPELDGPSMVTTRKGNDDN